MDLSTERLLLLPHSERNFAKIHAWQNDPELLELNADSVVFQTEEQTRKALERWIDASRNDIVHLAIHEKASLDLIGFAQIACIDYDHRRCKLALVIGEKALWGAGYGGEALRRIVSYCFLELSLNRIGAEMYSFNERSMRLFESAGFKREGTLRENVRKRGRFFDEYVYGLLRSDWAPFPPPVK
jgi:RimJ/RimL family protein N-acetyltransferase